MQRKLGCSFSSDSNPKVSLTETTLPGPDNLTNKPTQRVNNSVRRRITSSNHSKNVSRSRLNNSSPSLSNSTNLPNPNHKTKTHDRHNKKSSTTLLATNSSNDNTNKNCDVRLTVCNIRKSSNGLLENSRNNVNNLNLISSVSNSNLGPLSRKLQVSAVDRNRNIKFRKESKGIAHNDSHWTTTATKKPTTTTHTKKV